MGCEYHQTHGQWEQYFAEHEAAEKLRKQEEQFIFEEKGLQPPVMAVFLKGEEDGFNSN